MEAESFKARTGPKEARPAAPHCSALFSAMNGAFSLNDLNILLLAEKDDVQGAMFREHFHNFHNVNVIKTFDEDLDSIDCLAIPSASSYAHRGNEITDYYTRYEKGLLLVTSGLKTLAVHQGIFGPGRNGLLALLCESFTRFLSQLHDSSSISLPAADQLSLRCLPRSLTNRPTSPDVATPSLWASTVGYPRRQETSFSSTSRRSFLENSNPVPHSL